MAMQILTTHGPAGLVSVIRENIMKYTEIKKGRNAGMYEDENGVVYTERVAKKRMANHDLYHPFDNVLANRTKKKAVKKK